MSRLLHTSLLVSSLLTCLPISTQAHMQMSWPYPLRSPLDPAVPYDEKDYDMTSPLLPDGSNFPCKHYQDGADSYVTKATYISGGTYDMWLNGTAQHDGGSCQLSLSYDNGATFKVIKSMIGGCPLTHNYQFTIPSFAPSSDSALFSWSWFNLVGNREMYQNCARVKIISGPNQRYQRRRASSMDQLPDMFVCNVGNGCVTKEGSEVIFPNPGGDVVYGQDAIVPGPGPGFTISGVPAATTGSSTGGASGITTFSSSATVTSTTGSLPDVSATVTGLTSSESLASSTGSALDGASTSTGSKTSASLAPPTGTTTLESFTSSTGSTTSVPPGTFFTISGESGSTTSGSSIPASTISTILTSATSIPPLPFLNGTTPTPTTDFPTGTGFPETYTSTDTNDGFLTTTGNRTTHDFSTRSTTTASFLPTITTLSTTDHTITSITTSTTQFTTLPATTTTSTPSFTSHSTIPTTFLTSISTSTITLSTSPSPSSPSSTTLPLPCTPGTFTCNTSSTFSQCVSTSDSSTYIYMGAVAPGTTCTNGQILRASDGPCTPSGSIFCHGSNAFYMCDQGGLVDMGPVAGGTVCRDGEIVAA